MAVIVEKRYGRNVLIDCMLDPRELLARYNRPPRRLTIAATRTLALWSPELLQKIGAHTADGKN